MPPRGILTADDGGGGKRGKKKESHISRFFFSHCWLMRYDRVNRKKERECVRKRSFADFYWFFMPAPKATTIAIFAEMFLRISCWSITRRRKKKIK